MPLTRVEVTAANPLRVCVGQPCHRKLLRHWRAKKARCARDFNVEVKTRCLPLRFPAGAALLYARENAPAVLDVG